MPRKADGQPRSPVPSGPDRITLTGFFEKSRLPLRSVHPSAIACRSPERTSGIRPGMATISAIQAVVLLEPAALPMGFGTSVVSLPSLPKMSRYHSPHLPALHPGGLEAVVARGRDKVLLWSQALSRWLGASAAAAGPPMPLVIKRGSVEAAHPARDPDALPSVFLPCWAPRSRARLDRDIARDEAGEQVRKPYSSALMLQVA